MGSNHAGNQLHYNFTANLFAGPIDELIHEIGAVHEIVMFAIGRLSNTPTAKAAEAYMREYYNKTKFSVLSQLLRPLYVGKNLGMQSLDQRIQSLKMTQHNNGNIELLTVQELFTHYQTHLAELDTSVIGAGDNLSPMFGPNVLQRPQQLSAETIGNENPSDKSHLVRSQLVLSQHICNRGEGTGNGTPNHCSRRSKRSPSSQSGPQHVKSK